MWCDMMWCDMIWYDVMWCDVMWYDVMWCDVMRYDALPVMLLVGETGTVMVLYLIWLLPSSTSPDSGLRCFPGVINIKILLCSVLHTQHYSTPPNSRQDLRRILFNYKCFQNSEKPFENNFVNFQGSLLYLIFILFT